MNSTIVFRPIVKMLGFAGTSTLVLMMGWTALAQAQVTPGNRQQLENEAIGESNRAGASEPSSPTVTPHTDPGMTTQPTTREITPQEMEQPSGVSRSNQDASNSDNIGPSAVPGQSVPGPSETPSGSPNVPGVSTYDDPNESRTEQDALNRPTGQELDETSSPSTVPGEGFPGPSETPSGSPNVPGTSPYDDPGMTPRS
ncbi:MAG: hypothetical protein MUF72_21640 [Elainella sp. Prado103]|jgi:hypothetical protein|nr:hypothetical protein [Elainella sp. Prado103]